MPLWGIPTHFIYSPRRVECAEHGIGVEHLPWSAGKRPVTLAMMCFLATWARRLSWLETARAFRTSWESVYRSVEWFVEWGLKHRKLEGLNNKIRVVTRRSYGFRTYDAMETALYHNLGRLPEPPTTHRFC